MTYFSHLKRLKLIYFRVLTTRSLCTSSPNGFDKSSFLIKKLKEVYCHQILPLEKHYHFDKFHSPPMSDADFEANPMILLVGQYSTGKSSFIRWIASFRINLYFHFSLNSGRRRIALYLFLHQNLYNKSNSSQVIL